MFTGSVATGKKVMAQAAQTLTPVSLELGGKDPMIVLADADLERATNAAVSYGLNNSGQVCISVERIYVEEPVHDEFLDAADREGRGAAPGPARASRARSTSGRSSSRRRSSSIEAHVADAVEKGATRRHRRRARRRARALLPADGARRRRPLDALHDRGDVRPDAAGDAGRRRRRRRSSSPTRARTASRRRSGPATRCAARRSRAGSRPARVCVNDAQVNYAALELPMGGWKESGLGSRHGAGRHPQVHASASR